MRDIIKYPLSTEKGMKLMEAENKLVFVVDKKARKAEIKEELEKLFSVTVKNVNTLVDRKGRKKAYVTFGGETIAIDLATQLGLM
ncbi:MAG: 50S ribosomal protein L23 [Candidatus Woesearchaeota archaeon]|nr:MAG: 50S ribosomal protein L23 [Candidatus Woesearchaeota archaeon]